MKTDDIIMKKWCFGMGRAKVREEAKMNRSGELETYKTYPKYRTIVLKVNEVTKKGDSYNIKGKQYSSLKGKPKEVTLSLKEKNGAYYVAGQKKPFFKVQNPNLVVESGFPPVGSLIVVDKKHAIVTKVGRNELTVWLNNNYKTITCRPGTIKWYSDKILASVG
jgi:hypothetical protein